MVIARAHHRGSFTTWARVGAILGVALVSIPLRTVRGQTVATSPEPTEWQVWAFGRLGGASSAPGAVATSGGGVLTSLGGGVAASYGPLLGMVRVTDSEQLFVGPGVRDDALLVGVRSRDDHLFAAGAVGIARATAFQTTDGSGTITGSPRTTFGYDGSVHAAFRAAGIALSVSGVVGPQKTSYVAVALGVELGWFGR